MWCGPFAVRWPSIGAFTRRTALVHEEQEDCVSASDLAAYGAARSVLSSSGSSRLLAGVSSGQETRNDRLAVMRALPPRKHRARLLVFGCAATAASARDESARHDRLP